MIRGEIENEGLAFYFGMPNATGRFQLRMLRISADEISCRVAPKNSTYRHELSLAGVSAFRKSIAGASLQRMTLETGGGSI